MSKSHLLKYLLISPNLPVGGFCYSEGMESFLHNKNLTDSNSVKDLIISELKIGQIRLDARHLLDFFDLLINASVISFEDNFLFLILSTRSHNFKLFISDITRLP